MNILTNIIVPQPIYYSGGCLPLGESIFFYLILSVSLLILLCFTIPIIYSSIPELVDDYRDMFSDIKERRDRRKEQKLAQAQKILQEERYDAFEHLVKLAMSQRDEWRDKTLTFCDMKVGDLICMKYGDIDEIFQLEKITLYSDGCIDQLLFRGLYSGIYGFNFWSLRTDKDPRQHIESYMIIRTK